MCQQEELIEVNQITVKVVVFDLWNTLVYDSSHEIHQEIANILGFETKDEFWDYLGEHFFGTKSSFYDYIDSLIKQRDLPDETLDKIKSLWEKTKDYVNIFPETVKTLEEFSKKYKLVLLSNTAEKEGKEAMGKFGLEKYFDEILLSGSLGLAKPDPKIFKLVLEKTNVRPEEILVVGDNLETDIIPARILGMKGILIDTREKYTEYENKDWYIRSLGDLKL
jgi:HAD superfamily hydrolase (TIGR01549 family)